MTRTLQVMKFGGTSVGDATCIRRSAQIVAQAAKQHRVTVVVSAMSGVTNRLIEAAHQAKQGDREAGRALADALYQQHFAALDALVRSAETKESVQGRVKE